MPIRPLRTCLEQGCPALVPSGRCPQHAQATRQHYKRHYSGTRGLNYGRRWQKVRLLFLQQHPLCVLCEAEHMVEPATDVDHIQPHRGDYALFWDESNWQPLCKRHHSEKTAKEVGWSAR
jgi:5-methylcytosine-specific restriction protein A